MFKNKKLFYFLLPIITLLFASISLAQGSDCRPGDYVKTEDYNPTTGIYSCTDHLTGKKYTPDTNNANDSCTSTGNNIGMGPKILGHYLGCDPSCPPSNGGCNFQHAVKFILYLVGNAYKLGIALAIAMIIWAGYKIIFAGAKGEDYKEGGKIIKTALIGFAITVLASFIVQLILKIFY